MSDGQVGQQCIQENAPKALTATCVGNRRAMSGGLARHIANHEASGKRYCAQEKFAAACTGALVERGMLPGTLPWDMQDNSACVRVQSRRCLPDVHAAVGPASNNASAKNM